MIYWGFYECWGETKRRRPLFWSTDSLDDFVECGATAQKSFLAQRSSHICIGDSRMHVLTIWRFFFAQRLSQPPYRWQLVARIDKLTFLLLLLLAQRLSPPLSRWQLVARIDNWTLFARISSRLSYIVTRMYWWSHAFVAHRSSPPSCCTYNLTLFWLRQRHHLCVALTDSLTLFWLRDRHYFCVTLTDNPIKYR